MKPFYQFILYWCSCGIQLVLGTLGFLEVIRYTQKLNPSLDLLCHHVTLSICIINKPSLSLICTAKNWSEKYLHVVSARLVEAKNIKLMPLPCLRSKAHQEIWEILSYIRAWFVFKLCYANFPTNINCLHTTSD